MNKYIDKEREREYDFDDTRFEDLYECDEDSDIDEFVIRHMTESLANTSVLGMKGTVKHAYRSGITPDNYTVDYNNVLYKQQAFVLSKRMCAWLFDHSIDGYYDDPDEDQTFMIDFIKSAVDEESFSEKEEISRLLHDVILIDFLYDSNDKEVIICE